MTNGTFEDQRSQFLEHYGKKGMRWGHRKAADSGGSSSGDKKGFFDKPSGAKALLLGSYGKKSAYTDPQALKARTVAGHLRTVDVIASVGSFGAQVIAQKTGNQGAALAGTALGLVANGTFITSRVIGTAGAVMQKNINDREVAE